MTSPSPASVPTEEDVARAIYEATGPWLACNFGKGWTLTDFGFADERTRAIHLAMARAVQPLFAPILAERENLACNLDAIQSDHADTLAMLIEANAERREFKARALAAEAALASARKEERERCLGIVNAQVPEWVKQRSGPYWDGYREAMEDAADDIHKGAAAIRAQGE